MRAALRNKRAVGAYYHSSSYLIISYHEREEVNGALISFESRLLIIVLLHYRFKR